MVDELLGSRYSNWSASFKTRRDVGWGWDSGKKTTNSERKSYDQAHFLVLEHMEVVEPYVLKHKQLIVQQNSGTGEGWVAKKHMKEFNN